MIAAIVDDITSFLSLDHRRIDAALARFHQEVDSDRAQAYLDAFEAMLLKHIHCEEAVLFPAFEEKLGAEALACSSSMRLQHDELRLRIEELRRAVGREGFERRNVEEVLIEALTDHNHAEDDFIYPWMDSAFTREERLKLLKTLEIRLSGGAMPQRVSEFFEKDHREIDALLAAVDYAKPKESYEPFHEFHMRLERHIHWEEGVLFPVVAQKAPMLAQGPIRVMLREHEELRAHKSAALKALKAGDAAKAREAASAMLAVLGDHNSKEERILYPACDDLLTETEAEELLARVRALQSRRPNKAAEAGQNA